MELRLANRCTFVLITYLIQECATKSWWTRTWAKSTCDFKTSLGARAISDIYTPVAMAQTNAMQNALIHSDTVITVGFTEAAINGAQLATNVISTWQKTQDVVTKTVKLTTKFMKVAGYVAPILGIICDSLDAAIEVNSPTAEDILAEVNKAMRRMSDEVDRRLDEMKLYVDEKILTLEKDLYANKYTFLFRYWSECVKTQTHRDSELCQFEAYRMISSSLNEFVLFYDRLNQTTGEFVDIKNTNLKDKLDEVHRMEVNLPNFRNYAFLSLVAATSLKTTYGFQWTEYQRYLNTTKKNRKWWKLPKNCTRFLANQKKELEKEDKKDDWIVDGHSEYEKPQRVWKRLYCTYKIDFEDSAKLFKMYGDAVINVLSQPNADSPEVPFDLNSIQYKGLAEQKEGTVPYFYRDPMSDSGRMHSQDLTCMSEETKCTAGECEAQVVLMRQFPLGPEDEERRYTKKCIPQTKFTDWREVSINATDEKEFAKVKAHCYATINKKNEEYNEKRATVKEFWQKNVKEVTDCWDQLAQGTTKECNHGNPVIESDIRKERKGRKKRYIKNISYG